MSARSCPTHCPGPSCCSKGSIQQQQHRLLLRFNLRDPGGQSLMLFRRTGKICLPMAQLAHHYPWRWGRDLLEGYSQCLRCCTHVVVAQCYLTHSLASTLHRNSQSCLSEQRSNRKWEGKSPAQTVLPCCRLDKPLYFKISDLFLMITLLPTGGKTL